MSHVVHISNVLPDIVLVRVVPVLDFPGLKLLLPPVKHCIELLLLLCHLTTCVVSLTRLLIGSDRRGRHRWCRCLLFGGGPLFYVLVFQVALFATVRGEGVLGATPGAVPLVGGRFVQSALET